MGCTICQMHVVIPCRLVQTQTPMKVERDTPCASIHSCPGCWICCMMFKDHLMPEHWKKVCPASAFLTFVRHRHSGIRVSPRYRWSRISPALLSYPCVLCIKMYRYGIMGFTIHKIHVFWSLQFQHVCNFLPFCTRTVFAKFWGYKKVLQ